MIGFVLTHAAREARSSVRRLGVYMLAITLGVAALVAINSLRVSVVSSLGDEARALLGADLRLSSNRPFPDSVQLVLDSAVAGGIRVATVTHVVTMALGPDGRARLIQLRAVTGGYPFYGSFATRPAGLWPPAGTDAIADDALLAQLELAHGDTLRIGQARFVVRGTPANLPAEATFQSAVGPRVFMDGTRLDDTGLLVFGSLVRYQAYLEFEDARALERWLDRRHALFQRQLVGYDTAADQAEMLGYALDNLGRFLALIGLAALLLGGVGVASAVHVFVREKRTTIAVLRCIGATQRAAFSAYLVQAALLGLGGALLGALLGIALQEFVPRAFAGLLPAGVSPGIAWPAVWAGVGIGAAVALLFALLPLLEIRGISPLRALRHGIEPDAVRFDVPRTLTYAALAAGIVALGVWQAGDRIVGVTFAGGLIATLGILRAAAWLLTRATRRFLPQRAAFTMRQGVAGLFRPYNQTAAVIMALGFGIFLVSTLWIVQRNLLDWIAVERAVAQPNFVVFDIQRDQRASVDSLLAVHGAAAAELVPIVPARIARINDATVNELLGRPIEPWAVRREYRHTYRAELTDAETLVDGAWWDAHAADAVPREVGRISIERDLARSLGVGIGDRITWNFQGIEIETEIASTRAVEWARFETNFFFVFEPGIIDEAPQMLVALVRVPDAVDRARLQGELVGLHANLTAVDLADVQRTIADIIGKAALAIRFMASFAVFAGVLVLAGAIAAARFQRVRESVLLRTLGATRADVRSILLAEYVALGTIAAFTGIALGTLAAWALVHHLFELPFRAQLADAAVMFVVVTAATAALGMSNSGEALRGTPLAALREAA